MHRRIESECDLLSKFERRLYNREEKRKMLLVSTIFEIRYEAMVRSDGRVENSDNRTLPVTLLYFIAMAEIILWESTDNLCWLCRFKVPMMIVWPRARLSSLSLPLDMVTQHVDRDDQGRSTPRRVVCPFTSHTCSTNSALAVLLNHLRTVYSPPLHRPLQNGHL